MDKKIDDVRMEQSNADHFNDYLKVRAEKSGLYFVDFSLNGQDRDAGADYLFAADSNFSLVEYKDSEVCIAAEGDKSRRRTLCELLEHKKNTKWKTCHDICHFIAWRHQDEDLRFNVYRHEVCNTKIFPESKISCSVPNVNFRITGTLFADDFLRGNRSLDLASFEEYLEWLLTEGSGSLSNTVQLAVSNPNKHVFSTKRFGSVAAANDWIKEQKSFAPKWTGTNSPNP